MPIKNITAPEDRIYSIGSKVTKDGALMLDVYDHKNSEQVFGNIPIRELIEHLNTIEGVEASYTPPVKMPQGIGAVVRLNGVTYVRDGFDEQYPWSSELRRSEFPDNWHGFKTPNLVILSEGVTP